MRYALMGLLAFGVVGGYGSAIARAAYWRGACHGSAWQEGHGGRHGFGPHRFEEAREEPKAVAQPQTVVVQQPAPAAAPAPQIFVIMPGGAQPAAVQPQTIIVPATVAPAVQASPVVAPTPGQ